jgi:alpha-1,2-mannosyltransferase
MNSIGDPQAESSAGQAAGRRLWISWLPPVIVACAFALLMLAAPARMLRKPPADLEVYFRGAERMAQNLSPYVSYSIQQGHVTVELPYLYPPLLAILIRPLLPLSPTQRYLAWNLLSFGALLAGAAFAASCLNFSPLARYRWRRRFGVIAAAACIFPPTWLGFGEGQTDALLFALLCGAVYGALSSRSCLGGTLLALAVWIKVSPLLLLLPAVRFKRWAVLLWFFIAGGALLALMLALGAAWPRFLEYAVYIRTEVGALWVQSLRNLSLHAVLMSRSHWLLAKLWTALLAGAYLLFLARLRAPSSHVQLQAYGGAIVLLLLISPVLWMHHFLWCLLPFAAFAGLPAPSQTRRTIYLAILGAIILVQAQSNSLSLLAEHHPGSAIALGLRVIPGVVLTAFGALLVGRALGENQKGELEPRDTGLEKQNSSPLLP